MNLLTYLRNLTTSSEQNSSSVNLFRIIYIYIWSYPMNYASWVDVLETSKNLVDKKLNMIIRQFLCPHYVVQICTHQMCYEVTGRGGKQLCYHIIFCFSKISATRYVLQYTSSLNSLTDFSQWIQMFKP